MSVVNEERNMLMKRFANKAAIRIEDTLYSTSLLKPNAQNNRLFPVHAEAVERLNSTMERHIRGNSQVYQTMVYKDTPREELIIKWWNGLIETPEFKALPLKIQNQELEQAKKLGPTSRYSIEKLFEGFVAHVDTSNKTLNKNLSEWIEAAEYFVMHVEDVMKIVERKYPEEYAKVISKFYDIDEAFGKLPPDKSGGDPYFIRTDRKIGGVQANKLYHKDSLKVSRSPGSSVYYEMFIRVQNKGNNLVKGLEPISNPEVENAWLPEKNRVVQGDSRSWQFLLKNISDVITKLPKLVDPIFVGWCDQGTKNEIMKNTINEFRGKYLFDSFDATEYDATTDPENFALGIHVIYEICRKIGLDPDKLVKEREVIRHYLEDPTLTPWGAFFRKSTPSGHNFTGPNGTITNLLRCYIQTKRLLKVSWGELNQLLLSAIEKKVAYFSAVGDDAFQLRDLNATQDEIADENNSDGMTSNEIKILLDPDLIHFLQFIYYKDDNYEVYGYYPVSRVVEHGLFQEKADQYTAESVATQAIVQNINNAKENPCQDYLIKFFLEGDKKYRLGSKMGVLNLFKLAAGDRTVAEFLGREWDPSYQQMSWEQYGEVLQDTVRKIESMGRKLYP